MLEAGRIAWEDLKPEAQDALRWARASEQGPAVGTRALLVGIVRADRGNNPVESLLTSSGVTTQALFDVLMNEFGAPTIAPYAVLDEPLTDMPPLTSDAQAVLARAATVAVKTGRKRIDVAMLLQALAGIPSRAMSALVQIVGRETVVALGSGAIVPAKGTLPVGAVALGHMEGDGAFVYGGQGFAVPGPVVVAHQDHATATHARVIYDTRPLRLGPMRELAADLVAFDLLDVDRPLPLAVVPRIARWSEEDWCRIVYDLSYGYEVDRGQFVEDATGGWRIDIASGTVPPPIGALVYGRSGLALGITTAMDRSRATFAPLHGLGLGAAPDRAKTGTLVGAGNDVVGDHDRLGFQLYVDAFADLILSEHTKPPLTVGVFGAWGMGKSFLLRHIHDEIARRQARDPGLRPRVHVVRFNAWEYSATEAAWPGLVRGIVDQLDGLKTWPWHRRLRTRMSVNLSRRWRTTGPRLVGIGAVLLAAFVGALVNGAGMIAAGLVVLTAILGLGGIAKIASDPVADWVAKLIADTDYGRQLTMMTDIRHDLRKLEERLHGAVPGRILVLIDDLDRCEPTKAVEVLQAINLLLNFTGFIVFLGIDARIVTGAIEKHYEGLLGKAGASGYEYLDKIVQIPFRIPEPDAEAMMALLAAEMGDPPAPADEPAAAPAATAPPVPNPSAGPVAPTTVVAEMPPVEAAAAGSVATIAEVPFTFDELEAFRSFVDQLRPNPRHLKRVINVYRLVRSLAAASGDALILDTPRATVRWLLMWSQWPSLSLAMMEAYDGWGDDDVPEGDPVLVLLRHIGAEKLPRGPIDDDPALLFHMLAVENAAFAWDDLRRVRAYTVNFNPAVT